MESCEGSYEKLNAALIILEVSTRILESTYGAYPAEKGPNEA
jgi:hypothetical protein